MTDNQIKVGDTVPWDKVPSASMVRWRWDGHGNEFYWKRHNFVASLVRTHDGRWRGPGDDNGSFAPDEPVTIIALDVPTDATAEQLRTLAEVFEVQEALVHLPIAAIGSEFANIQVLAERLHAGGWRPGMTVGDAVRILSAEAD